MNNENIAAGTVAVVKVGRNEVEVTIIARLENGWKVKSNSSGREFTVRAIERMLNNAPENNEGATVPAISATPAAPADGTGTDDNAAPVEVPAAAQEGVTPESAPESAVQVTAKKLSLLDAAAQVLKKSQVPMSSKEIVSKAIAAGLWLPTAAKTPEQSLYSAMFREIRDKENSRFKKSVTHKGSFEYNR